MKIAALLAILAVAGSASKSAAPRLDAYVLLGDGRIAKLDVASGRVVARRSLGRTPRRIPEHGPMLTVDGARVYALVPTRPETLIVTDRALHVKSKTALPRDVLYRGVVRVAGQTYAFGYRQGRILDPASGERESDAVVTSIGASVRSWTIRKAEGQDWWEWSGSASSDGRRLALSYHGSTSGADVIDLSARDLAAPCGPVTEPTFLGCTPDVHGAVQPYQDGWLATTGGQ